MIRVPPPPKQRQRHRSRRSPLRPTAATVVRVAALLALALLVAGGALPTTGVRAQAAAPTVAAPLDDLDAAARARLLASVVSLAPLEPDSGKPLPWGGGSGTLVSADGLILTNYHVVSEADGVEAHRWHAVMPTDPERADQVPPFAYRARFVAGRPEVDLALLEIVADADGAPLAAGERFPFAELGDPEALRLGDPLVVVGYPSVSGATVTVTRGVMSGWLGEDYIGSGRDWIKTDAKISYGNSGGGAFDAQGRLVGVPTEFYTRPYDDGFTDLQSYLRPVTLALPLLVERIPALAEQLAGAGGAPTAPEPIGEANDDFGVLANGATVERTLRMPAYFGDVSYHSYRIEVPVGATDLTVTVRGEGGADVDLAVLYGSVIVDYGAVDFLDTEVAADATFRSPRPRVGTYHLDVLNLGGGVAPYRLEASIGGAVEAPLAVPWTDSGIVGALVRGQRAEGALASIPGGGSFHTFTVWVPPGTAAITFRLEADGDLDLAIKPGSEIASYAGDGDWLQSDFATAASAKLSVVTPQPGMWFVDVINLIQSDAPIDYTLTVR